jgi:hypothetical protein
MNSKSNGMARRAAGVMAAAAIALGALLASPQLASAAVAPPTVPASIAVPAGNVVSSVGRAQGYQVYVCQPTGWVLKQPMAWLLQNGQPFATHYAGPTWTALDGSSVVAARDGSAPAPIPGAIPWLRLKTTSTSGPAGTFTGTTYIQRINTTGGVAPATGCDASRLGATAAVYYTADYYFYRAG